jgi:phage I-like protein
MALAMQEQAALTFHLALGADKQPPTEFRLFKAGKNKTLKGELSFSARSAKECAAFAEELGRDLVIDYEHASLGASSAVDPSKAGEAAGFFSIETRDDGLWATNVSWTDDAAAKLSARKYRYFSPVVTYDRETREVLSVFNAALTNNPATLAQKPLVASATPVAPFLETAVANAFNVALSLHPDAAESVALTALEKLKAGAEALLSATGKATVSEAVGTISAWKAGAEKAEALAAELATLKAAAVDGQVAALIAEGKKAGKVAPAQVELLTKMGKRDVEELKAFLAASPKLMGGAAIEPTSDAAGVGAVGLTATELAVLNLMGVKPEAFAKTKAAFGGVVPEGINTPSSN